MKHRSSLVLLVALALGIFANVGASVAQEAGLTIWTDDQRLPAFPVQADQREEAGREREVRPERDRKTGPRRSDARVLEENEGPCRECQGVMQNSYYRIFCTCII